MKKFTQSILLILMTIAFTNLNANTLNIQGQISPVNGSIPITITYQDAGMTSTASVMTDISGNFFYADSNVTSSQGLTIVSFNNCGGNMVSDSMYYSPNGAGFLSANYGVIEYCTDLNNYLTAMGSITNAPSNFTINLSYDYGVTFSSAVLSASGDFSEMVAVPSGINYVLMSFTDCNNVLQTDTAPIAPALIGYIASFASANYCNSVLNLTTVNGSFTNATANLTYSISLDEGLTFQTYTYSPTPTGAFSHTYNVYSTSGVAIIQYVDCNGNTQTDSTTNISGSPNQEIFDFGNMDYCNNTPSSTTVSGSFSNISGNVSYSISLDNGLTFQSYTYIANPTGGFSHTFNTLSTSGVAIIQYIDCNGNSYTDTTYNDSGNSNQEVFNFENIDVCPNTIPTECSAGYIVSQNIIIDSFNNIVASENVMIVNTSTGDNLTYTWDFGDNSPTYTGLNFIHTYSSEGPWTLCLTVDDGNNCISTFCDSLMIDANGVLTGKTNRGFTIQMGTGEDDTNGPTGINDLADNMSFDLFPNPAKNEVNLNLHSKISDKATIIIYNALGALVNYQTTEVKTGDQTIKINIEALNTGLFIIQLKTNEGTISSKLIKK